MHCLGFHRMYLITQFYLNSYFSLKGINKLFLIDSFVFKVSLYIPQNCLISLIISFDGTCSISLTRSTLDQIGAYT